ncbi:IclR family transcriptional regulator [Brevundimonas staleyi]|uniref:IclR family transcriptional regulator n=1 Tax=Brevundimonas staleyi TaxID=74326 RepID=A0ABW0FST9_9CAUL
MAAKPKTRPAAAGVAAAERALEVLTAFRTGDDALGLIELSERTGLVKSTILRLVASLEAFNLVVRLPDGRYQIGSEVVRLNSIYQESIDLGRHIQPVLADLAHRTGETATFYVRHGAERLCLYRVSSPSTLRVEVQPGMSRPMDGAASAEILRLFEKWPEAKPELPALPCYTSGATTPHVASMSVPIIGQGNLLVGALSLVGPDVRLSRDRADALSKTLLDAGATLSATLGGTTTDIYAVPIALASAKQTA